MPTIDQSAELKSISRELETQLKKFRRDVGCFRDLGSAPGAVRDRAAQALSEAVNDSFDLLWRVDAHREHFSAGYVELCKASGKVETAALLGQKASNCHLAVTKAVVDWYLGMYVFLDVDEPATSTEFRKAIDKRSHEIQAWAAAEPIQEFDFDEVASLLNMELSKALFCFSQEDAEVSLEGWLGITLDLERHIARREGRDAEFGKYMIPWRTFLAIHKAGENGLPRKELRKKWLDRYASDDLIYKHINRANCILAPIGVRIHANGEAVYSLIA